MKGWILVLAVAAGYDAWAIKTKHETLSSAYWRARNSRGGSLAVAAVGGLVYHLLFEQPRPRTTIAPL